ncbi:MAG: hypothetical protein ACRBN8_46335 [Nannocystales bacterium]
MNEPTQPKLPWSSVREAAAAALEDLDNPTAWLALLDATTRYQQAASAGLNRGTRFRLVASIAGRPDGTTEERLAACSALASLPRPAAAVARVH